MGDTKGTWYLSSDKSQEFYNVYGLALKNGQKLSLAEKPGEYVPLLVDIDLKKKLMVIQIMGLMIFITMKI